MFLLDFQQNLEITSKRQFFLPESVKSQKNLLITFNNMTETAIIPGSQLLIYQNED